MFSHMQREMLDLRHPPFSKYSLKTYFDRSFFNAEIFMRTEKGPLNLTVKQMLPIELENLIHEYAIQMGNLETLPEIRAVQELTNKSNRTLIAIANKHFGVPMPVLMEIHLREEDDEPLFIDFVLTPEAVNDFDETVSLCVIRNWATSSLFWLFITREPNLYHGPYAIIFEKSLLCKLLNIITSF